MQSRKNCDISEGQVLSVTSKKLVAVFNNGIGTYSVDSGYLKRTDGLLSAVLRFEQPITRNCSMILVELGFLRPCASGVWSWRDNFSCRISSKGSTLSKLHEKMYRIRFSRTQGWSEPKSPAAFRARGSRQFVYLRIRRRSWPFFAHGHIFGTIIYTKKVFGAKVFFKKSYRNWRHASVWDCETCSTREGGSWMWYMAEGNKSAI